ncbi:PREDICTED: serine/threonine-protein kinase VRK1-like [Polistes canadensis]|uniref:serine/threonine-protein kinase VRK1-like n=1 Tax=Polistes canadensis TaxID=91411 RepID=UPI000718DC76|nr:PREDICTED: serine/threonine-protein kinase VRK1-like [Polistes canadensis]
MCAKVAKKAPKKKGNLYKMPDPIPTGTILSDIKGKNWILDKSIGVGGFGEVYSGAAYEDKVPKNFPNVIKIEPHENGPLFVEMHFYMRQARKEDIQAWKTKRKLSVLGMPNYVASGSHEHKNVKYRFLVMDRYGTDLWKLFKQNNKRFPEHTVYKVAIQIINVLEYIHSKAYVHADIKGSNLLLSTKHPDQVYLVDFGLATRYTTKAEYKPDPKRAHDGTIEYTSRDAHIGLPTMRGDLEILGYNIIQWLSGSLPWDKNSVPSSPSVVQKEKEKAFENLPKFLDQCFDGLTPEPVLKYMKLVEAMKFNETPNYKKFIEILTNGLKKLNHTPDGKLEFTNASSPTKKAAISKSTPKKVNKIVGIKRSSPRAKTASPMRNNALDDSNVGVIIDKKRAKLVDLKKALNDIKSSDEPDEEYDIKIVKKAKIKKKTPTKEKTKKLIKTKTKTNQFNDSDSDTAEIISKGTKSRPVKSPKANSKLKTIIHSDTSDEDMFQD